MLHIISDATEHNSSFALFGNADSDWAVEVCHYYSPLGIVFKFSGAIIV